MSWVPTPHVATESSGSVQVAGPIVVRELLEQAEIAGLLPVALTSPGPALRGRLAVAIEEAIEDALQRRGACPPGVGAATSLEGSLSDQLYRARLLELRGIALAIPSLAGIANIAGVLDAEDSAVLRWWLDVCTRTPVRLILDESNRALGVYGAPRPLSELLEATVPLSGPVDGSRALAPEIGDSVQTMELSEPPPAVIERDGALAFEQSLEADGPPSESPAPAPEPRSAEADGPRPVHAPEPTREPRDTDGMEALGDITDAILKSLVDRGAESDFVKHFDKDDPRELEPPRAEPSRAAPAVPRPEPRRPEPSPAASKEAPPAPSLVVPPLYPNAREEWRTWMADLSAARGAKPLAVIERMFVSSYVPLADAVLRGIADSEAEALLARWSQSFARSYEEAFDALRVRTKRPTMVLDAPEIALRIGRLHGARSVQLLLIDAMRFDLGLRVEQRVRALIGQQATLAERLLLWSALPSTTEVQLELIARGHEGLAEPTRGQSFEVPVARGRGAATLRRVKTGHRELLKLDLIEARLAEPGPAEGERLDALADETARIVADYLARQPPRTLVVAFGDHGFLLDRLDGSSTRAARQGGASPEEVLVPAFAWLVGGVH